MTNENDIDPNLQRLIDAHPLLFRGQPPALSSYASAGWYGLIDELCGDIESTLGPESCARITVRQIKEKYGALRFYVAFGDRSDVHIDSVSETGHDHGVLQAGASGDVELDASEDDVRELIAATIKKSESTCEICALPGEVREMRGWLTALCDTHFYGAQSMSQENPNPSTGSVRVLVLSDLHLELGTSYTLPQGLDFDMVILAGDIQAPGRKAVIWAQRQSVFASKPVVIVPGNHEYYGAPTMHQELSAMHELAKGSNVHVLHRDTVVINGVRFVGCTLWTDFLLPIQVKGVLDTDISVALSEANRRLNDFHLIQVDETVIRQNRHRPFKRTLRAQDTLAMHYVDRDWLRQALKKPFSGATVVVTHHAPSPLSVEDKHAGDLLSPAFASDLPDDSEDYFEVPHLWVHGHTHSAANYTKRTHCQVVSNPRGYRLKDGSFENKSFDPGLVIEVGKSTWPPQND